MKIFKSHLTGLIECDYRKFDASPGAVQAASDRTENKNQDFMHSRVWSAWLIN